MVLTCQTNYNTPILVDYYNNSRYAPPYDLANCTAYACGRASFLLYKQDVNKIVGGLMTVHPNIINICGNGCDFGLLAKEIYPEYCSDVPKLGSLISYNNGAAGHVAVVEAVIDRDTIIVSSSGWSKHGQDHTKWVWNETLTRSNGWLSSWMISRGGYEFITFYDCFHGNNPYDSYNLSGTPTPVPDFPIYPGGSIDAGYYTAWTTANVKNYKRLRKKKIYPKLNYYRR